MKILFVQVMCALLFIFLGNAQETKESYVLDFKDQEYDVVRFEDIRISSSRLLPNELLNNLGVPIKKDVYVYEEGDGPDGYLETTYLKYHSVEITYSMVYDEVILSSVDIFKEGIQIKFYDLAISVGDSINSLQDLFPKSFEEFSVKNQEQGTLDNLYIFLIEEKNDCRYKRLITISAANNMIKKVSIRLDEGA